MRRSSLYLALATLAFSGCHCGQNGLLRTGPSQLQICRVDAGGELCDDTLAAGVNLSVDFGQGQPGAPVARNLVLRAKGDGSVQLLRLGLVATSDPGYAVTGIPAVPYELQPGNDLHLAINFDAARGGPAAAQLEVLSDFPTRPRDVVDLAAVGLAPRLCIDAADTDFGDVAINVTKEKTATLRSCGVLPLTISSLATSAPFALDAGGPALPQTLAPGATLPLPLSFKPTAAGPAQQPLTPATNEPVPSRFKLTGNGSLCTLDLSPGLLDYGTVSTSVRVSKTFYLRSVGDSDCTVTAIRGPTGSPGFTITSQPSLPLVMPVGLEIPVVIDFLPAATGSAAAQVQVDSNDSTLTTQSVSLKATGSVPPPCVFTATPASITFGSVDVGQSATVNVVVTNHGTAECYITGGGATGNAGDTSFAATMSSGIGSNPIAAGASLTVPVKYAPASPALHLGQLLVKYADQPIAIGANSVGSVTIPLQGGVLAPKMCITPASLDYGAVPAGTKVDKAFTVSSCGDGALTVRGLALGSGTSRDFTLTQALSVPLTLAKGTSANIHVQYLPASASAAAGHVEVYGNDPANLTGKVDLKGNLGACTTALVCTPSSVQFTGTEVNQSSAQPVTCTSAGGAVTVTGISASPGASGSLSLVAGVLPVTIPAGGTLRAEARFAPTAAGAAVATFTLNAGVCDAKVDVTAIGTPANLPKCPVATTFTPKVKWAWNGGKVMSSYSNVTMTPVVVNLTDDNGDGKVDENDVPDVVFASCSTASCCVNCLDPQHMENADLSGEAVLRSISGKDGSDHWTAQDALRHVPAGAQIATTDLDGDGLPEIIAVQHSFRTGQTCPNQPIDSLPMCYKYVTGSLLALDAAGNLKWVSEAWNQPPTVVENDSSLLVADLDQDGYPEIIFGDTVFDSTGHVKWRMTKTVGNSGHGTFAAAVDVDGDGKLEVIAGPTAYRADGSVLWSNGSVADGITFIMDTDGDGKPEVVVRPYTNTLVILDGATGAVKKKIELPSSSDKNNLGNAISTDACPSGPSAADFLGNGKMQIAMPAGNWFFLLDGVTGAILWQKAIEDYDGQCGASGAAVFSFFGDGKADVVYHDTQFIYVWRADGTEVYRSPRTSSTLFETPVIADVDNDGHAEILITNEGLGGTNNGLTALGDAANSWPATRRVWSQWNYHVTDANENGTSPRAEAPFWKTSKLWRGNPPLCTAH